MHIYFSGIGGSGLSALAHLALDVGYDVSGSDLQDSPNLQSLAKRGADVKASQDGSQIESAHKNNPIDWIVVSSAIPSDHTERTFAKKHDIGLTKRDAFINYVLSEHKLKLIAVSGTHGKTTVSAMIAWLAMELERPMSWIIGTNVPFGNSGHLEPKSKYLVLEADEYDRHMLNYEPFLTVIPSLDYDHPDIYPTHEDYTAAFNQLVTQSQLTIAWHADAQQLTFTNAVFELPEDRNFSAVPLAGSHNRKNAWLAATALERLNVIGEKLDDWWDVLGRFKSYPGTQRRFEKLADNLYTDYAHHPREIDATLAQARELSGFNDLVVVYQPHQNSRQHEVKDGYPVAFAEADKVYWLPTYLSREDPQLKTLQPDQFIKAIGADKAEAAKMDDHLYQRITEELAKGNLVLVMGAGDVDAWVRHHPSCNPEATTKS